jgi:two-component sensor histidine kinase
VGLPPESDPLRVTSVGLELVNTLAEQLNGSMEVDRSQGTEFRITFTVSK